MYVYVAWAVNSNHRYILYKISASSKYKNLSIGAKSLTRVLYTRAPQRNPKCSKTSQACQGL